MENPSKEKAGYNEYDNFSFHPKNILLVLLLFSLSTLFLALSVSFVYTRVQNGQPAIQLPSLFIFNTLILIASSWAMVWAKRSYQKDATKTYQQALIITIFLSVFFMIMQIIAWKQLFSQNIFITTDNSASYLYVISGLHFAHVIAGLPFLIVFLITARKRMREPVSVLVYFSDPEKRLKLRLLTIYWHFLDALWIYLVLFFWINQLIR